MPAGGGLCCHRLPLGFWANILLHGRSHWQQVKQLHVPKLFIGDRDNFTTVETLHRYPDGSSANSRSSSSGSSRGGAESTEGGGLPFLCGAMAGAGRYGVVMGC